MAHDRAQFDKRLRRLDRKHRRMANGFSPVVLPDGLISIRPRRRAPQLPFKGILYLILGFIIFKAIAISHYGMPGYVERVELLRAGTVFERAGAWLLQPEQASSWLAVQIASFIS